MAKKDRWFLPTNTDNLKMMVAQGLITSPDGFSPEKYYLDELENYAPYIPLFANSIPAKTLTLIVSEQDNMTACLIEIDLSKIQGIQESDYQKPDLLLILAPLPLSCIKQIILNSAEDKKSLENEQKLSSNFILAELKLQIANKTEVRLFGDKNQQGRLTSAEGGTDDSNLQTNKVLEKSINYAKTYAFGGSLLNLFYLAKNGKISHQTYQDFYQFKLDNQLVTDRLCVYHYFYNDHSNEDKLQKMYNALIETALTSIDFKNDVINLLEANNWDDKLKQRTQELASILRDFENNDTSISDKFKAAKKPLEKLLLMLFHRDKSELLFAYYLELFSEEDYLLFAMVFGIRDKFIQCPKFLRQYQGLQSFISQQMAQYAHNSIGSDIQFKPLMPPKTIWALLNLANNKKKIIEKLSLQQCAETVMSGDYRCQSNKNIYMGIVEPKYNILAEEYFRAMANKNISTEAYNQFATLK